MNERIQQILTNTTRAIDADPTQQDAYIERGKAYYLLNKFSESVTDLTEAIKLEATAEGYYWRALAYRKLDRSELAIGDLSQAIEIGFVKEQYNEADLYFHRGSLSEEINNTDSAMQDYHVALTIDPSHPLALGSRGMLYRTLRQLEMAQIDLDKAITQMEHPHFLYNRGLLWIDKEETARAVNDFSKAIAIDPSHSDSYYVRALLYANTGRSHEGITDLTQVLNLRPSHPQAHGQRAKLYHRTKQLSPAENDYERQLQITPEDAVLLHNLGDLYREMSRFQECIEVCERSITIDPSPDTYCTLGRGHLGFDRLDQALEQFAQAITIDSLHANGHLFSAIVLTEQEETAKALVLLERAIELNPELRIYADSAAEFAPLRANPLWDAIFNPTDQES